MNGECVNSKNIWREKFDFPKQCFSGEIVCSENIYIAIDDVFAMTEAPREGLAPQSYLQATGMCGRPFLPEDSFDPHDPRYGRRCRVRSPAGGVARPAGPAAGAARLHEEVAQDDATSVRDRQEWRIRTQRDFQSITRTVISPVSAATRMRAERGNGRANITAGHWFGAVRTAPMPALQSWQMATSFILRYDKGAEKKFTRTLE